MRGYTVIQSPGFEDFFALVPTVIPTPSPSPTTQPPTSDPTDNQNIAITIIRTTKSYASEESFKIMDGYTVVYTQPSISTFQNYTWSITLVNKTYTLVMTDSYGDGWSIGSTVEFKVGNTSFGSYRLSSGTISQVSLSFTVIEPTQPPTTLPPTTQAPTTQPPTTQPPTPTSTPTPTPTPEPWFPIYDPFILGDNCNYESQDTCIEQIISDLDVLRLYLAIRDQYPYQALRHTRVLALMGMNEAALALFHESLSHQVFNSNPIDCYFYSDYLVPRYIDANLAIPLISLTQYTYPSRLVFSDGTFKREGMNTVIQWMVDNRNKGYFLNLKFFQITRHKAATFEATSNGAALQANIVANLKIMCNDTINFPVLEEMNFNGNAYNQYANGFDTALLNACNDVTVRNVTIKASSQYDIMNTMCSTSLSNTPNYNYYNMTNPAEIIQCRYTWNWELMDYYSRYASGPYPNDDSVHCE